MTRPPPLGRQLKNWVGNKLAGTVIGDISAPIGFYEFGTNSEWVY
jgi:hypothetical protein